MGAFVAANRRVEMAPAKTWLEQVHQSNIARRKMMANHPFHDEVYLGKTDGRFNDIPAELRQVVWTGTAAVIGAKGGKLGKVVETQGVYAGRMKGVLFEPTEEMQVANPDIVFMCNQGFARDGSLYLPFSNARTNKPVVNDEEMQEAEVVKLRFNGAIFQREIKSRYGGAFESIGDETSLSYVSDSIVLGLLRRYDYVDFVNRSGVYLDEYPSFGLGVVREAAGGSAPVESTAPTEG